MKIVKIKDPIYLAEISIIINCSYDEFKDYIIKKYKIKEWKQVGGRCGEHFCITASNGFVYNIIWVETFKWTIGCQSTMAHELLHCATNVLIRVGVDIVDSEGSEALAYYYEFLFRETWNKLKPNKRKKKTIKKNETD